MLENLILFFIEPRRSEHRSNADKYTLTQLWFSTKYQRWNNTGSSTLNRRNSFKVVSTLFCQRWNNVEKHTSAQLSFSTKFQRWNNVGSSTLFQRRFANVETTSINVRRLNFHFQPNINVETTLMNVDDQRWFNVDVFAGMWSIFHFQPHFHCHESYNLIETDALDFCIFFRISSTIFGW